MNYSINNYEICTVSEICFELWKMQNQSIPFNRLSRSNDETESKKINNLGIEAHIKHHVTKSVYLI